MRFKRSKIYLSVIPIVVIGLVIGFIGAVMGIGGGFILVPLLIYVLRVPTSTVIGTSMVLTLVTMVFATMGLSILSEMAIQADHRVLTAKEGFAPIERTEVALVAAPDASPATLRLAGRLAQFCDDVQAKAA